MTDLKKWKKIGEKTLYKGYYSLIRKSFIMPDGNKAGFEIKKEDDFVSILALTPENKIVLCREFRPGTEMIYDEVPAGIIEKGEEPLDAAKRELLEEVGMSGEFEFVTRFVFGAYCTKYNYCFTARNCKKVQESNLDEKEFIIPVEKTIEEFIEQLMSGQLTDAPAGFAGLYHLGLL